MSLALALNNALTGLNINQQSLSVLSQNIANANTQGYSRKSVLQESVYLDGRGVGVSIKDITRKVDEYLLTSIRQQNSAAGRASTASDYFERTQLLLGNPGAGNSLDAFITNFFNNVQSLAQTPESNTLRVGMINTAKSLGQQANQLSQGLQGLRLQADQDIVSAVASINKDIQDLRQLNLTISQDAALGKPVAELLDRRDFVLRDLAQYMDVQTYIRTNGSLTVLTASGVTLLDENAYELRYSAAGALATFTNGTALSPLLLQRIDEAGTDIGAPTVIATSGTGAGVTTLLTTGKLKALLDLRDRQLPAMLSQFDTLVSTMRDQFNRVHNSGIAFPGANSYTGSHAVFAQDYSQWSGSLRLALLGANGQPVASPYSDETSGMRPFNLDLANLDTGLGNGLVSVEGMINEINQYFGAPGNKAVVGNLNNIRLVSDVTNLPQTPPEFNFDFDLENISAQSANFFVTGMQILDDTATDITPLTNNIPKIDLAATGTYVTTSASTTVTVNTTATPGVGIGDRVFLSTPASLSIDGIPASELSGFVVVTGVSGNSFTFETETAASAGGSFDEASQTMTPRYSEVGAGTYGRTKNDGVLTADLSGNDSSTFYTIKLNVATEDENGNVTTALVTYRIDNAQANLLNHRYSVSDVSGGGEMVRPANSQPRARAILVDADGNELPKFGGRYTTAQQGFLKIVATNSAHALAIDSLDSTELGQPNSTPAVAGTNRGFSYFFGLNNFFVQPDDEDTITNSALNLQVEQRLIDNPNLIALGRLVQSAAPADPSLPPFYTYERSSGDNSIISQMAALSNTLMAFASAGGLGASSQTLGGYAASIIGAASNTAALAKSDEQNAQTLMDGYAQRSDAISGVNLDEELANTIIYQNAYTASARVITVTSALYEILLNSFQ